MKQIFNFCGKYLNEKKGILTLYMLICIFGSMGGRSCHNCHIIAARSSRSRNFRRTSCFAFLTREAMPREWALRSCALAAGA